MAGRFDDAIYAAANADDPRIGARDEKWQTKSESSARRIAATRATILRFLQAIEDEGTTVLELREELDP